MGNFGPLVLCLQVPFCCFLSSVTRSLAPPVVHIRPHSFGAMSHVVSGYIPNQAHLPSNVTAGGCARQRVRSFPFWPSHTPTHSLTHSLTPCTPVETPHSRPPDTGSTPLRLCATGNRQPQTASSHISSSITAAPLSSLLCSMLLLSPPATARSVPPRFAHLLSHALSQCLEPSFPIFVEFAA
jgi:hypothetical protein